MYVSSNICVPQYAEMDYELKSAESFTICAQINCRYTTNIHMYVYTHTYIHRCVSHKAYGVHEQ